MSTAKSSAGERKVLARYEADEGERQLVAQHINGRVALSDVPTGEQGVFTSSNATSAPSTGSSRTTSPRQPSAGAARWLLASGGTD